MPRVPPFLGPRPQPAAAPQHQLVPALFAAFVWYNTAAARDAPGDCAAISAAFSCRISGPSTTAVSGAARYCRVPSADVPMAFISSLSRKPGHRMHSGFHRARFFFSYSDGRCGVTARVHSRETPLDHSSPSRRFPQNTFRLAPNGTRRLDDAGRCRVAVRNAVTADPEGLLDNPDANDANAADVRTRLEVHGYRSLLSTCYYQLPVTHFQVATTTTRKKRRQRSRWREG